MLFLFFLLLYINATFGFIMKIFIDGGGNWKKIVDRYLALVEFDEIYVFEPNPLFYDSYNFSNYKLIKKAMWIEDAMMPFYISKDSNQVASSLFEDKFCKVNNELVSNYWNESIDVECIDFSKWLKDNFDLNDRITLKLDIEGAEFPVLLKMINDETIKMIEKLYVEFHLSTCPNQQDNYKKILDSFNELNIKLYDWD